ncbi:MAG: glycosyltransferase family 4 protein [Bacteroidales bacterium]|nr:glycosyltransferase family 4 protein [Bacteroidales bacterium]
MKRVLVISYYWPPSGGSGVQRWVKFSKYLPAHQWQPVIYTPENPESVAIDHTLEKDIPTEAEILRTRIFEPYEIYRKLTGKKASNVVNPISSGKKSPVARLALWVRANLFVPDPRITWVRPSVKYLKKYLKEHPVDAIVSTGPPHSMHLIARALAKSTGIPWVADFRDPWTNMFFFKHLPLGPLARRRQYRLEEKVLRDADAIISVSPLVAEEFREMTDTPVYMITNGYDEDDYRDEDCAVQPAPEGKFRIVHTGLFAADGNPLTLWKVLADKCSEDIAFSEAMSLELIGKTDAEIISAIRSAGLGDYLSAPGYLSHEETVFRQREASMLILPLRREPEYRKVLPGKIFEYLASRRPVLQIGEPEGAAASIIGSVNAGVCADWEDYSTLRAYVDTLWERFRSGEDLAETGDIERYSRRCTTASLAALLDTLSTEKM